MSLHRNHMTSRSHGLDVWIQRAKGCVRLRAIGDMGIVNHLGSIIRKGPEASLVAKNLNRLTLEYIDFPSKSSFDYVPYDIERNNFSWIL